MFNKVFISYAKEDIDKAEMLYENLQKSGLKPWLDKKELKIGSDWDFYIKRALRESDFVILLLSSISVKKRGYVQREYKLAIEYAETKLEEDIYILPVLLDECTVPYNLDKFHWQKFNDEKTIENVVKAINYQRKKYIDNSSIEEIELNTYLIESAELEIDDLSEFIDFNCSYPIFNQNKYFDAKFVNSIIACKIYEIISSHRKYLIEEKKWIIEKANKNNYINISFNIIQLNETLLSIEIVDDSFINWAHPNTYIKTINILFNPERLISISDLVDYQNFEIFIKDCIRIYGDKEISNSLLEYIKYYDETTLDFTISQNKITIILSNHLPRVILFGGFIEVPLKKIKNKLLS